MSHFVFDQLIGSFFYAHTEVAETMLPKNLSLLQPHHGISVVDITVFNITDSEVGAYAEVVISLAVVPWAPQAEKLPYAAFYPVFLATTTEVSRNYAAKRWNLPKYEHDVEISFIKDEQRHYAHIRQGGKTLLELQVKPVGKYEPSNRYYQCFSKDDYNLYRSTVDIMGNLCEHEDEKGLLSIGNHSAIAPFSELFYEVIPFREQSMTSGDDYFGELLLHEELRK